MSKVIGLWSTSGENAYILLVITVPRSAKGQLILDAHILQKMGNLLLLRHVLCSPYTPALLTILTQVLVFTCNRLIPHTI